MHAIEPLVHGYSNRLHNSGPCRGQEQHRTSAIGSQFGIPLRALLDRWERLNPSGAVAKRCAKDMPLSRPEAAQCVATALGALTGQPVRQSLDLRALCGALLTAAQERGLLEGIVLSCALVPASPAKWRRETAPDDTTVALALLAYAYAQPPMVLWMGEPSGRAMANRGMLMVQWMHAERAGADARRAWSALLAHKPVPRSGQ